MLVGGGGGCLYVFVCVCVCVCTRTRKCALRIVCTDEILRFTNTLIIYYYYFIFGMFFYSTEVMQTARYLHTYNYIKSARFIRVGVGVGGKGGDCVCACVRTSAEDDNFQGGGVGVPNGFIYFEFLYFGLSEKTLFQTILGLIGISIRSVL